LEEDDDFSNAILSEKSSSNEVFVDRIPAYGNRSGWVPRIIEVNHVYFF